MTDFSVFVGAVHLIAGLGVQGKMGNSIESIPYFYPFSTLCTSG